MEGSVGSRWAWGESRVRLPVVLLHEGTIGNQRCPGNQIAEDDTIFIDAFGAAHSIGVLSRRPVGALAACGHVPPTADRRNITGAEVPTLAMAVREAARSSR